MMASVAAYEHFSRIVLSQYSTNIGESLYPVKDEGDTYYTNSVFIFGVFME